MEPVGRGSMQWLFVENNAAGTPGCTLARLIVLAARRMKCCRLRIGFTNAAISSGRRSFALSDRLPARSRSAPYREIACQVIVADFDRLGVFLQQGLLCRGLFPLLNAKCFDHRVAFARFKVFKPFGNHLFLQRFSKRGQPVLSGLHLPIDLVVALFRGGDLRSFRWIRVARSV
jgi:hypothetical protein